ncbi:MAG: M60 family metallopeptidase, partial [Firmicutes bacterium]|nr:M60 family metallopeptidase [Bacillota bacterium]
DLTGRNPFGNVQTAIRTTRTGIPNYWALSGNPILINRPYMPEFIGQINSHGDWGFGVIHEFGHNFDSSRWNFDVEFFANFKMAYVVDRHNATVLTNYTGLQDLIRYYRTDANPSGSGLAYVDSIAKNIYHHDGLTYNFLIIQQKIGWEPLRQTFRYFNDLQTSQVPASNIDKLNLFLTKLSDFSNQDVFAMLTAQEKAVYEQRFGGALQRYEVSEYKEPNEVTVEYRSSSHTSGEVPPKQIVETPGGFIVQNQGTLKRDGYTFLGWNNKGGDFIYKPGTTIGWDRVMYGMLYLDAVWEVAQPSIPTLSPDIEWSEYIIPELGMEMLITTQPVVQFANYANVKLGIISPPNSYYGELYVLINVEWQFAGLILLKDMLHRLDLRTAERIVANIDKDNANKKEGVHGILENWKLAFLFAKDSIATLREEPLNEENLESLVNIVKVLVDMAGEKLLPLVAEKIEPFLDGVLEEILNTASMLAQNTHILAIAFNLYHVIAANLPLNGFLIEHRRMLNSALEVTYERENNRSIGLVFHQANEPHAGMWVGNTGNGVANGCGPFSIYNALYHLRGRDNKIPASEIIRDLEHLGAFNLGGVWGTNPFSIWVYMNITVNDTVDLMYLPRNLDDDIRNSKATILLYKGGSLTYIHYVMIVPTPSGEFAILNWENREGTTVTDSVDGWLKGTSNVENQTRNTRNYLPLAIITVS